METENLEENYKVVKENNYEIVYDMHETFYGTHEFAVQDPDGYICVLAGK